MRTVSKPKPPPPGPLGYCAICVAGGMTTPARHVLRWNGQQLPACPVHVTKFGGVPAAERNRLGRTEMIGRLR